jgi:hypothetical protein
MLDATMALRPKGGVGRDSSIFIGGVPEESISTTLQ